MSVEVGRSLDRLFLRFCEVSEEAGNVVFDGFRVVAGEINRVAEPAFIEIPGSLDGPSIFGGVREWDFVTTVL